MKIYFILAVFLISANFTFNGTPNWAAEIDHQTAPVADFPIHEGMLVYHSYNDYSAGGGKLFLYDFAANKRIDISENWPLHHAMNGHFSPDGKKIVFMALPKGMTGYYQWDIYLWDLATQNPINLTPNNGIPDEDPKFFPDGEQVVFKQNGDIKILNLLTKEIIPVTSDGFLIEESMPYPTTDGKKILYEKNAKIYIINIDGTNSRSLSNADNLASYYPIVRDQESFLHPKWAPSSNHRDQVYLSFILPQPSVYCLFNDINSDNSDPYPVPGTDYVFFSSNREGGQGNWDIYLGDLVTGQVWTLDQFGINTSLGELGSCYFYKNPALVHHGKEIYPTVYKLDQNYPNPFNSTTTINFELAVASRVTLQIFSVNGSYLETLLDEVKIPAKYKVSWQPHDISTGVYFYRLSTGAEILVRKCIYLK
jgi:Tol biopolymer transport system component